MNNDITTQVTWKAEIRPRRSILIRTAKGNNVAELEADALDQASGFFGPDIEIEIDHNYTANVHTSLPEVELRKYYATVVVREVLPADPEAPADYED